MQDFKFGYQSLQCYIINISQYEANVYDNPLRVKHSSAFIWKRQKWLYRVLPSNPSYVSYVKWMIAD